MPKQATPIIVAIVAILLIAAGAFFVLNKKSTAPKQSNTASQEQKSQESGSIKNSIKSLLSQGKSVTCTVKYPSAEQATEGTLYVSGKQMRGDFKTTVNGKEMDSHMITDQTYSYSWSSATPQGAKMKIDQVEAPNASPVSGQVDTNSEVDMKCSPWGVDNSKFTPPSNINFMDISQMMKPAASPSTQSTNQNQGASPCDQITDPAAKAACKSAGY